jgi:Uma2 family endonuclease
VQTAKRSSLYAQLQLLPETLIGEILNGQLYTQPRPAPKHLRAALRLGADLEGAFDRGRGGPGGWWILAEPEIHFTREVEVVVPDLAGWMRKRMPSLPETAYFDSVPDWICEILSPATASKDREIKMPLYARYQVHYAWLIDPQARTLETFVLQEGTWRALDRFVGDEPVAAAPFAAITIALADLWS